MSRTPQIYIPPFGGPLRWQDTSHVILPAAVRAYVANRKNRNEAVSADQVELVRDYCEYYINAPCWKTTGAEKDFRELRERVKHLKTAGEISWWMKDCLKHGIDPL